MRRVLPFLLALFLAACTTTRQEATSSGTFGVTGSMLTTPYSMVPGVNPIVVGAAAAAAVNAFLPEWTLDEIPLGQDRYRILLRKKTFSSGGDGQAAQVFKYRAEQIALKNGYTRYQVLEFNEGIDSGLAGSQRVAQGVIQGVK